MNFTLDHTIEIIERTPSVLRYLLQGLDEEWTHNNEGGESWSPYDVVGHLIHGDRQHWMPRLNKILEHGDTEAFEPFDRFAQLTESKGKTLNNLLDEFEALRLANIKTLRRMNLTEKQFSLIGLHPSIGRVSLKNLLATWAAHDLNHIMQIVRVIAKQYSDHVGPWGENLSILKTKV
ncbi:MAG: DinB family protein [Ignavibacteria bacterium]|nr:DinB family protein [Ignavibacteria bacterium]